MPGGAHLRECLESWPLAFNCQLPTTGSAPNPTIKKRVTGVPSGVSGNRLVLARLSRAGRLTSILKNNALNWTFEARSEGFEPPTF
jgi:hypothetical protein